MGSRRGGVRRVGPRRVGDPKGGATKGGGPKFRAFLSFRHNIFFLSSLSWGSSWILAVFEAPGPEMCTFGHHNTTTPQHHNTTTPHEHRRFGPIGLRQIGVSRPTQIWTHKTGPSRTGLSRTGLSRASSLQQQRKQHTTTNHNNHNNHHVSIPSVPISFVFCCHDEPHWAAFLKSCSASQAATTALVVAALAATPLSSSGAEEGKGRGVGKNAELHGDDLDDPHSPAGALRSACRGAWRGSAADSL